ALYERLDEVKGKRRETLAEHRADALLSRELASLRRDVALDLPGGLADLARRPPDNKALNELFTKLEFTGLAVRYVEEEPVPEGPELVQTGFATVQTEAELDALGRALAASERFAFQAFLSDVHPVAARLVGLAFATDLERAWYVPLGHWTLEPRGQLHAAAVLARLGPLLADPAKEKLVTDVKTAIETGTRHGFELRGVTFDPMLASYLADAGQFEHSLDNIAKGSLGHEAVAYSAIAGSGKRQEPPEQVPVQNFAPWACERAQLTVAATDALRPRLAELEASAALLDDVELPLARVLADMELTGVKVDVALLNELSAELGARARVLEAEAHAAAGKEFAIGSPKQLGDVLFTDLGLPTVKKTRTGWSTDSEVLEELMESHDHPLPALVLEWRKVQKLKSTYTDVLPALVRKETGRVHTLFNQAVAATGRLSSESPNLQNIPVRTEEGRRIRAAFVPADGNLLVSADYSQIELRILAHLSGDERMTRGFVDGADIHRRTASEMLGVPEGDITALQRGMAKAINFGILYGMSAARLSREQGITRAEARDYIDAYYARYPRIRRWKEDVLNEARLRGYVKTLFGRVRMVGDLRSRNRMASMAAERVAINTPVQGSAADIIKIAMVSLHERLRREIPGASLLLQVHDELVF
ncbi:MAG: DNA polymerase I, partial [Myxococcales bacterium]|nr:DNA polymerase I [Myxococcales bacterium]